MLGAGVELVRRDSGCPDAAAISAANHGGTGAGSAAPAGPSGRTRIGSNGIDPPAAIKQAPPKIQTRTSVLGGTPTPNSSSTPRGSITARER